ncbi:Fimbrial protein [compost metagenome]
MFAFIKGCGRREVSACKVFAICGVATLLAGWMSGVLADCATSNVQAVTFGNVHVLLGAPVGTQIATTNASFSVSCSGGVGTPPYSGFYLQAGNSGPGRTRVSLPDGSFAFQTNIPGIGLRISTLSGHNNPLMISSLNVGGWDAYYVTTLNSLSPTTFTMKYDLVVTGAVSAGNVTGTLWQNLFHDVGHNYSGVMAGAMVSAGVIRVDPVVPSCAITTHDANLGDQPSWAFQGIGTTVGSATWAYDVNCPISPNNVIASYSPMYGYVNSGTDGLINLATGAGAATGLAVQIQEPSTTPKNLTIPTTLAGTLGEPGSWSVSGKAVYYQTDATVTPGIAKSALTVTLTYN